MNVRNAEKGTVRNGLGTVLAVSGGNLQANTPIIGWDWDTTPSQVWRADRSAGFCSAKCSPQCSASCAGAGPGTGTCVGNCMGTCLPGCMNTWP